MSSPYAQELILPNGQRREAALAGHPGNIENNLHNLDISTGDYNDLTFLKLLLPGEPGFAEGFPNVVPKVVEMAANYAVMDILGDTFIDLETMQQRRYVVAPVHNPVKQRLWPGMPIDDQLETIEELYHVMEPRIDWRRALCLEGIQLGKAMATDGYVRMYTQRINGWKLTNGYRLWQIGSYLLNEAEPAPNYLPAAEAA